MSWGSSESKPHGIFRIPTERGGFPVDHAASPWTFAGMDVEVSDNLGFLPTFRRILIWRSC